MKGGSVLKAKIVLRLELCPDFKGLKGDELREKSGIESAEFVHSAGFIGGAWTLEGAIKMAEISMEKHKELKKEEHIGK